MPNNHKRADRRIRRSRKMMQDALLELLATKEYPKITISEITHKADVARTTFYSHFKSKDELLMSYIDDIFETFFGGLGTQFTPDEQNGNSHEIPLILCEEWKRNKNSLDLIRSANIDFMIYQRIKENHQRAFVNSPVNILGNSSNKVLEQYIVSCVSSGTFGVLMHWTDNGMKETSKEIAKILSHFINKDAFNQLRDNLETELGSSF